MEKQKYKKKNGKLIKKDLYNVIISFVTKSSNQQKNIETNQ